jgi:hypothetical protein
MAKPKSADFDTRYPAISVKNLGLPSIILPKNLITSSVASIPPHFFSYHLLGRMSRAIGEIIMDLSVVEEKLGLETGPRTLIQRRYENALTSSPP